MFTYGIVGRIVFRYKTKSGRYIYPSISTRDAFVVSANRGMMISSGQFYDNGFSFTTAYNFFGGDIFSLNIDEEYVTV
jgi:hypothetical protein